MFYFLGMSASQWPFPGKLREATSKCSTGCQEQALVVRDKAERRLRYFPEQNAKENISRFYPQNWVGRKHLSVVRDANSDLPIKKKWRVGLRLFLWFPLKSSWCWGCLRRELIFSYFRQTETGIKKTGIKSCKFICGVTPNILKKSVQRANTHKATLKSHLHLWASLKQRNEVLYPQGWCTQQTRHSCKEHLYNVCLSHPPRRTRHWFPGRRHRPAPFLCLQGQTGQMLFLGSFYSYEYKVGYFSLWSQNVSWKWVFFL